MDARDAMNVDFYDPDFYDARIGRGPRVGLLYLERARAHGGPVVEVGCGTGDVLIPIARAGVDVIGIDLSPRMVEHARRRLATEPPEVRARAHLVQGRVETWTCPTTPRQVFLTNDFVAHLRERDTLRRVLNAARAMLAGGGRLVLDVEDFDVVALARYAEADAAVARFRGRYALSADTEVVVSECPVYTPADGLLVTHFHYDIVGTGGVVQRRLARTLVQHPWRRDEILFALEATGFVIEDTTPRALPDGPTGVVIAAVARGR